MKHFESLRFKWNIPVKGLNSNLPFILLFLFERERERERERELCIYRNNSKDGINIS